MVGAAGDETGEKTALDGCARRAASQEAGEENSPQAHATSRAGKTWRRKREEWSDMKEPQLGVVPRRCGARVGEQAGVSDQTGR